VRIKVQRKAVLSVDLDEADAEVLAADLHYLLEHTKNMPAVVRAQEATFMIESQERLRQFVEIIKQALKGQP
jgi:hypothetical protein